MLTSWWSSLSGVGVSNSAHAPMLEMSVGFFWTLFHCGFGIWFPLSVLILVLKREPDVPNWW